MCESHVCSFVRRAAAVLGFGAVLSSANAQQSGVETIVVSDRPAQSEIDLTPGGVTLLDGYDLRERNASSLADLLRYAPGVWAESAHGTDTMFFSSRGSNLDATDYDMNGIALLQDGLPVTTADGNNHNRVLDPLSARFATVARGANSFKYGASTLGGAIDFESPTARSSEPLQAYFNGGSHGQLLARGTIGHVSGEGGDALLTLETKRWDGYREHNEQRRHGLYVNGGWHPSERTESRFYLTYVENDVELPGALSRAQFASDPSQANAAALTGRFQLNVDTLRIANKTVLELGADQRLELGFSLENQNLYHPIVDVRVDSDGSGPALPEQVFSLLVATDHEEQGGMLRYSKRAGRHDLLFGMSYGRGTVEGGDYWNDAGTPAFLLTAVDNRATRLELYALDRWQLSDALMVELGAQGVAAGRDVVNSDAESGAVRELRDDFSRINPRLGVIYSATEGVDLFANVSSLYEPPTNYELEDEASGGSSILDAMHGTVLEVGTRGRSTASAIAWSWEVAVYYAAIEDEILSVDDPAAPGTSLSANIAKTTHAGLEAFVSAALPIGRRGAMLVPQLSLTVNEFSFDGDASYGDNDLPAAPGHVLRGELLYRHANGVFAGPTFDIVAERFADFANSYRVDSYSLLGVRAGWANERWSFYAEVLNVADERYVATVGVRDVASVDDALLNPGLPRSAYFGVTGRF